jgi:hypothetical protein
MKANASDDDGVSVPHGSSENPFQTREPPAGSDISILSAPRTNSISVDRKLKDFVAPPSRPHSVLRKW